MARQQGALRVEYTGTIPAELRDCLTCLDGAAVAESKALIITTGDPGRLLARIGPYLRDAGMGVERVEIRGGEPCDGRPGSGGNDDGLSAA